MARRRQKETIRDKMIPGIKATETELQDVRNRADILGLTVSDYIRLMLFERAPRHKLNRLSLVDTKIIAELARQGADLRDLWNRHGYENGYPAEASAELLRQMSETVSVIRQVHELHIQKELRGDHDRQAHSET